ncbi:MAG TPA: PLP-dependent aminotransferase family protein [Candidatus Limnocylindrales bacterium]|nr:PLP-dependent aminotransferase family protein [Candidatus Limnocylindrales bacterium]
MELLLTLDRGGAEPLHRQLTAAIRTAVREGRLAADTTLPSTRSLATQLRVSRGIVVEAYEQLVAEGYLDARPGGATRVARAAATAAPPPPASLHPRTWEFDFRPGRPDVTEFPRQAWLRSMRRVLAEAPADRLSYLGGRGVPELRIALASYLNRVRGTAIEPGGVVICTGFAQGVALIAEALASRGGRRMAVEDPSDPEYRTAIAAAGLEPVGVPVDEHGLRVDALEAVDAEAVVVTAAHQYPTGGVLPPERRAALLAWAVRHDALIVEDDYDAEFRYDREPIGALQGLQPDHVVYAGSASKTLAPGLRLGWLAAPPSLVDPLTEAKQAADMGSSALDQLALADFIERGDLDRYLRRMRPIYRARRDALLAALATHHPDVRPVGASAGLHVLAWLPEDLDDTVVVARAGDAGIAISGLRQRWIGAPHPGLVFGYGSIPEGRIEPGVARLAGILRSMR